ncbi:hypothetical protein C8J57DRAFT_1515095 [Mycena rebaudengoi]|nr:hypothetical protein C8J57DRAFT_1515095 [Mycena rebaudengoi]
MTFVVNGQDEPRVVFNYHDLGAHDRAFNLTDETPLSIAPNSTSEFFNDARTDLQSLLIAIFPCEYWIHPAFIPCIFDGQDEPLLLRYSLPQRSTGSIWSPKYMYPNNIKWSNKQSKLYWRGISLNGGQVTGWDFHKFMRFKLPYYFSQNILISPTLRSRRSWARTAQSLNATAAIKHEFNITGDK